MPFKSEAERRLMQAAAEKKGGAGGVSQDTAKEMVADDKPGKLPERVGSRASRMYTKSKSKQ